MFSIGKREATYNRRVVITGLGVVSSLGIGWEEFWENLIAGKSGIRKITTFDVSQHDRHYAGEIANFDVKKFLKLRKASQMGRASQLAVAASLLSLRDSGITKETISKGKCGICIGTTMGEPQIMERLDEKYYPNKNLFVDFDSALSYPASTIAANVANILDLHGQNFVFSTACAAGNYSFAFAFDLIRNGKVDFMFAGGSDALSRIAFTGFGRLFAMSPDRCRPFDKNRKGMVLGEGSGIVFLETLEHARHRDAHIYAEVLGYGLSCDARHMTVPSVNGISKAIMWALSDSHLTLKDVDYISAHGTGTVENDVTECQAVRKVFGKEMDRIPMSSIKSMLGHTMGAAAALEAIACCLAIKNQEIPPTINFKEKDPQCDIDCVPNKGRKHKVSVALNNSQAFGGNNACVIFKICK